MNIFYLSRNPIEAAGFLVDRHILKMGLEGVQMLSTAHRILDGEQVLVDGKKHWRLLDERDEVLYKVCHQNHPCTKWVMDRAENYYWLMLHTNSIFFRFEKWRGKKHKSSELMVYLDRHPFNMKIGEHQTEPPMAMPDEHKRSNVIDSYREYYRSGKTNLHSWTCNERPDWI